MEYAGSSRRMAEDMAKIVLVDFFEKDYEESE